MDGPETGLSRDSRVIGRGLASLTLPGAWWLSMFPMIFSLGSQTLCVVFCKEANNGVALQSLTGLQIQVNLSAPAHLRRQGNGLKPRLQVLKSSGHIRIFVSLDIFLNKRF